MENYYKFLGETVSQATPRVSAECQNVRYFLNRWQYCQNKFRWACYREQHKLWYSQVKGKSSVEMLKTFIMNSQFSLTLHSYALCRKNYNIWVYVDVHHLNLNVLIPHLKNFKQFPSTTELEFEYLLFHTLRLLWSVYKSTLFM